MITAPYGYCPVCEAPGRDRERRPNGNDTCYKGHTYPSLSALDNRSLEKDAGRPNTRRVAERYLKTQ